MDDLNLSRPAVGDAVVIDGRKLRIREISRGSAHCTQAGPHWRTAALVASPDVLRLRWDHVAGVWRLPVAGGVR